MASAVERVSRKLSKAVGSLEFGDPVDVVYNPLEYAWKPHRAYIRRYARPGIRGLLLGMNPGPWGMAQTGVPFGEVAMVRSLYRRFLSSSWISSMSCFFPDSV